MYIITTRMQITQYTDKLGPHTSYDYQDPIYR